MLWNIFLIIIEVKHKDQLISNKLNYLILNDQKYYITNTVKNYKITILFRKKSMKYFYTISL